MALFTQPGGRLTAGQWWTGILYLVAFGFLSGFATGLLEGQTQMIVRLAVGAVIVAGFAILSAKRLRDIGKPVLPRLLIFAGLPAAALFMRITGFGFEDRVVNQMTVNAPLLGGLIVTTLAGAALIWAVVELGMGRSVPA
ncbi:hypothetical protein HKCCE3408_05475 [Rhodobacterales bacterium HKCCE3408]|nr:hypothetical protein [Rhodobacterales bacterium HKCCE3408]